MVKRAALLLILALTQCACAPKREPLRVGVLVWPPYELAYLARAENYFPADEVELVDYQSPAEVTRAYRHGLIDAFFLTTQFLLSGRAGLADSRIAYVIDYSAGGDSLLARPGIENLEALAGHTLAVEASPLGGYMLQSALESAKLDRSDLTLLFADTPDQVDAYMSGKADAVITYEPYRTRLLNAGARELFSSGSLPGEIIDALIASESSLDENAAELRHFVKGLERARSLLAREPDRALKRMMVREQLDEESFRHALHGARLITLEENRHLLGGAHPPLAQNLSLQAERMQRAGIGQPLENPEALIDARLVSGGSD